MAQCANGAAGWLLGFIRNVFLLALVGLLASATAVSAATEPASPEAAARVLDLRKFPRMDAAVVNQDTLAMLMYKVKADVTSAFAFQRKQLAQLGWKEAPGGYHDATNASGQFTKDGYRLSLSAYASGAAGENVTDVSLVNHGNVDTSALPTPPGVKPFYSAGGESSYLTDAPIAATAEACRKLLLAAGWEPYGSAGDEQSPILHFKRNGIFLRAWISAAPAQDNKTMIRYSTELLSADLPAPAETPDPRYNDSDKSLRFDWPNEDPKAVIDFYQARLPKQGWKATTDKPVTDDGKGTQFLVYRNAAGDLLSLDMQRFTGITRVKLQHRTAEEEARQAQLAKEALERRKQEMQKQPDIPAEPRVASSPRGGKKRNLAEIPGIPKLPEGIELPDVPEVGELMDELKKAGVANQPKTNKKPAAAAEGAFKVSQIAMPPNATSYEYQKIVKMIKVESAASPEALAQFFIDDLAGKGWTQPQDAHVGEDGGIVKLVRGDANLTIFVSNRDSGSEATLMCKELEWDKTPAAKVAAKTPAKKPAKPAIAEDEPHETPAEEPKQPAPRRVAIRVGEAEQAQNGATIWIDNKPIKLAYGVAYEDLREDEPRTEVLLSAKPIPGEKLAALLNAGKDGGDAAGFNSQLKLRFDAAGKLEYLFLYAEGLSVNKSGFVNDVIQGEIALADGRARGKAVMEKADKFFEHEYRFDATFDCKLATGPAAPGTPPPSEQDKLVADEEVTLPCPAIAGSRAASNTPFRQTLEVEIPAPLAAVVDFYRSELKKRGWKEDLNSGKLGSESAEMSFTSNDGTLGVRLSKAGDNVTAKVLARYPAKAKAAGISPQPGKGRLILGNASDQPTTVVINGQPYKVAAGLGAKNPKDGLSLHVQPGVYNCTIKYPGQPDRSEKLTIAVDQTWGLIVISPEGFFADQVY